VRNSLPRPSDISYGGMVDGGVPMPRLERRALFPHQRAGELPRIWGLGHPGCCPIGLTLLVLVTP